MSWKAIVAVKCNGSLNETHWSAIKEWAGVERVWSTMGEWDFWVGFDSSVASQDQIESAVFELRKESWVGMTSTTWVKEW